MTPKVLRDAFVRALRELDPAAVVAGAVRSLPSDALVVAVGKAAPAMARGLLRVDRRARGIVVTTDETPCALPRSRFEVMRAGHPLPDRRSVEAAERVLSRVARHEGPLVVLLSGGASALLCAPTPPATLRDKRAVTEALLGAGATISEMNVVRRHLSRVKGGGLLRVARGPVRTWILSDVIDGAIEDVGSGVSVCDRTTVAQAHAIARRYGLGRFPFVETLKRASGARTTILAGPDDLARTIAKLLRRRGLRVALLPASRAPVEDLAREYLRRAKKLSVGHVVVRAAEPSVTLPRRAGKGGRSGHLVALVAPRLPPGVALLAGGSDGVDGSSDAAGAVADSSFHPRDLPRALARFDTARVLRRARAAIVTGPTGLNLADVHVLARIS